MTETPADRARPTELPGELVAELIAGGLAPTSVAELVRMALAEDLANGVDVTSRATVPAHARGSADFVARADGVVAGLPVAQATMAMACAPNAPSARRRCADGARVVAGQVLMSVTGPLLGLLRAERTALNLLAHASGVATLTRRFADALVGTGARVRDTRKTLPGLRALEKYAVRCGGGLNHRMSLSDAALIKDNHVLVAGGVAPAFRAVRSAWPDLPVEVECDTLEEVAEAVEVGADLILLDNMNSESMRAAVRLVGGRAALEASGGLTLERARDVAETGVDYLAVGALTQSARALDIALDLRAGEERFSAGEE